MSSEVALVRPRFPFKRVIFVGLGVIAAGFLVVFWQFRHPAFQTYSEDNLPQFIQAEFIDLDRVNGISKFRSGAGHDYSYGSDETCRSMKHYFSPLVLGGRGIEAFMQPPDLATATEIYSPVDGKIVSISGEQMPIGKQIHIRPDNHPDFVIRLFHVYPVGEMKMGTHLSAGQLVGHLHADQGTDISVEVNQLFGSQYFSYFSVMPDEIFTNYQSRGIERREDVVLTRAQRDAEPLTCNGEQFATNYGREAITDNYVFLNGFTLPMDQPTGPSQVKPTSQSQVRP